MDFAQQIPESKNKQSDKLNQLINNNFNWIPIRDKYSSSELDNSDVWLKNEKEKDDLLDNITYQDIDINKLNKYQRFTYNLVKHIM